MKCNIIYIYILDKIFIYFFKTNVLHGKDL